MPRRPRILLEQVPLQILRRSRNNQINRAKLVFPAFPYPRALRLLGLGIQPPTPSWGNMLTNAQELISSAPALAFYPGTLIFLTVIAVNFFGDGLQDAFDPRTESH